MRPTPSKLDRAVLALIFLCAALLLIPLRRYGLIINDEGWYLYPTLRLLEGDVLYRDAWTFYAPLRYHLLQLVFTLSEPSLLVARSVWVAMIIASAAFVYRVARRFVSPALAWLPALVYLLVPGPWHKATYTFCTVGFFLVVARVLERPASARRLLALGAVAGGSLLARQELGLAQTGLAVLLAAALPFVSRASDPESEAPSSLRAVGLVFAAAATVTIPVLAYYAAKGALPDLFEALFVRAFLQMGAWSSSDLTKIVSPSTLGMTLEGGLVGVLFLSLPLVYAGFGWLLVSELRRHGATPRNVLALSLFLYAIATLGQAYKPIVLVRFLQSAVPSYLLATWAGAAVAERLRRSERPVLARTGPRLVAGAGALAAFSLVWLVLLGAPRIWPSNAYTGSLRLLRDQEPVRVRGDLVHTDWATAEKIRLTRAFIGPHTEPGEPIFAAPTASLFYVLLERPNATRYLAEHREGDFAMSSEMKREEVAKLLASDTTYAVVSQRWWLMSDTPDAILQALIDSFGPVREYGDVLILKRRDHAAMPPLREVFARVQERGAGANDIRMLNEISRQYPDEPLPRILLARALVHSGRPSEAIAPLTEAAALDPVDASPLEQLALIHLRTGSISKSARFAQRAREVRDSPLLARLAERGRAGPEKRKR